MTIIHCSERQVITMGDREREIFAERGKERKEESKKHDQNW